MIKTKLAIMGFIAVSLTALTMPIVIAQQPPQQQDEIRSGIQQADHVTKFDLDSEVCLSTLTGGTVEGWCPDGNILRFKIEDPQYTENSVVTVTLSSPGIIAQVVPFPGDGHFVVTGFDRIGNIVEIPDDTNLNYIISNPNRGN